MGLERKQPRRQWAGVDSSPGSDDRVLNRPRGGQSAAAHLAHYNSLIAKLNDQAISEDKALEILQNPSFSMLVNALTLGKAMLVLAEKGFAECIEKSLTYTRIVTSIDSGTLLEVAVLMAAKNQDVAKQVLSKLSNKNVEPTKAAEAMQELMKINSELVEPLLSLSSLQYDGTRRREYLEAVQKALPAEADKLQERIENELNAAPEPKRRRRSESFTAALASEAVSPSAGPTKP